MNRKRITFAGLAAAAAVAVPVLPAPAGAATVHQFEGTVISVNRSAQSFRLRDVERGTVVVAVTRSTRYERVGGFAGLRSGMRSIEATVRRAGGRWVAVDVQRSGGGAHGGRSGADDNGGGRRGADDNGGGRRGADDGGGRHGAHHGPNHG